MNGWAHGERHRQHLILANMIKHGAPADRIKERRERILEMQRDRNAAKRLAMEARVREILGDEENTP